MNLSHAMKKTVEQETVINICEQLDRLPLESFGGIDVYKVVHGGVGYVPTWWDKIYDKVRQLKEQHEQITYKKSQKKSQYNKQRKALLTPQIIKWVKKNIQKGDSIFVKGARDGIGFRRVEDITPDHIVCRTLVVDRAVPGSPYSKHLARKYPEKFIWTEGNYITEHLLDKVIAVFRNNQRIPITKLL